jgi:hypothetical protein
MHAHKNTKHTKPHVHDITSPGHIVESAEAAVYELARDGQTVGLLVSSETADGGDD